MKLVKADESAFVRLPRGEYDRIVREFLGSDMDCAEVSDLHSSALSAYRSFSMCIKKAGHPVRVSKHGDSVFLIRGSR